MKIEMNPTPLYHDGFYWSSYEKDEYPHEIADEVDDFFKAVDQSLLDPQWAGMFSDYHGIVSVVEETMITSTLLCLDGFFSGKNRSPWLIDVNYFKFRRKIARKSELNLYEKILLKYGGIKRVHPLANENTWCFDTEGEPMLMHDRPMPDWFITDGMLPVFESYDGSQLFLDLNSEEVFWLPAGDYVKDGTFTMDEFEQKLNDYLNSPKVNGLRL